MVWHILRSAADPMQFYTGLAQDLRARLGQHNAGEVTHTAKFMPWTLVQYSAFPDRAKAAAFERYLKTGSGRAFALRHLR